MTRMGICDFRAAASVCSMLFGIFEHEGLRSITLRGNAGGSFAFQTRFQAKSCSLLRHEDLPHLSASQTSLVVKTIGRGLGEQALCVPVLGILVVSNIPDHSSYVNRDWTALFANIIAEIVDRNMDGVPDDPAVTEHMMSRPDGHFVFARSSNTGDDAADELASLLGSYIEISQEWDFSDGMLADFSRAAAFEEIFHVYQATLARTYPDVFGISDERCHDAQWSIFDGIPSAWQQVARRLAKHKHALSVMSKAQWQYKPKTCDSVPGCDFQQSSLMRCAYRASCNYWCFGLCCSSKGANSSGLQLRGGTCATPSCLGTEWFFQIYLQWTGQPDARFEGSNIGTGTGGEKFPEGRASVQRQLTEHDECVEFLSAMQSEMISSKPLTFNYAGKPGVAFSEVNRRHGLRSTAAKLAMPQSFILVATSACWMIGIS